MKRFLYGMLTSSLVFTSALTLQAKTESVNIPVKYNNIKVYRFSGWAKNFYVV